MITSTHRKFGATLLLSAILLTGIYSCGNNAATEEKKADTVVTPAPDTMTRADTAKKLAPGDTTQPSDTGREIKVPKATR